MRNQIRRRSVKMKWLLILVILFWKASNAQNSYLVCIYSKIPQAHWDRGSKSVGFIEDNIYIFDSSNVVKFKRYCRTSRFKAFYLLHNCIDPDSVQTIPLYLATIPYIKDSVLKKNSKVNQDTSYHSIPEIIELDSINAISTDYVVSIFSINYSDDVLFKDRDCFDYNDDRRGMRRRSNALINCPEFYLSLAGLKPKLIATIYLR